jgi:D-xylose reductase
MLNYTLTLNNGKKMPLVGHGLWKIPNEKTADHVYTAIKAGYRLFDGACGKSDPHYPNRSH